MYIYKMFMRITGYLVKVAYQDIKKALRQL